MVVYSVIEAKFKNKYDVESISCLGTFITKRKAIKQVEESKKRFISDNSCPKLLYDIILLEEKDKVIIDIRNKKTFKSDQIIILSIEESQLSL